MKEGGEHREPLVTIGMPVFNAERFIGRALDTLVSQKNGNFELIISDNASTDRTWEICLSYASSDDRIRYYRSKQNMGPVWNFNRVFELAGGEYFMWASDDDYWDSSYIRSCLDAFKKSKDIILVGTMCKVVNSETGNFYMIDEGFSTIGLSPRERFVKYKSVIHSGKHIGAIFYGLYKRDELKKVMPLKNVIATDHLVLAELCFQGEILTVQEPLMVKHYGGTSVSIESIAIVLGITNRFIIMFPYLKREILFQKIIFQTNKLALIEKIKLSIWSFCNYFFLEVKIVRNKIWIILPTWIKQAVKRFRAWPDLR